MLLDFIEGLPRYYVDRRKSVDALKSFLSKLDKRVAEEVHWLTHNAVDCVLSDAAFLAWCVTLFLFTEVVLTPFR